MIASIVTLLTSGAGGGIVGGVLGLFKQRSERKERIETARINLERDKIDYENSEKERQHALVMLERGAKLELEKVETEAEKEIEVSHQKALSSAQDALKNLKTSTGMDNYRASVRPTLAFWFVLLFTVLLCWAFYSFHESITEETGGKLLEKLFSTLTFTVTSIVTFYYVARRNSKPQL